MSKQPTTIDSVNFCVRHIEAYRVRRHEVRSFWFNKLQRVEWRLLVYMVSGEHPWVFKFSTEAAARKEETRIREAMTN